MTLSSVDLMWRWEVNQEVLCQYDPKFRWFDVNVRSEPIGSQSIWPSFPLIWCEGEKWTKRFSISMTLSSIDLMWRWEVNQEVLSQYDPQFHWFDVKVRSEPRGSQSVWPSVPLIWCEGEKWTKRFSVSMTVNSVDLIWRWEVNQEVLNQYDPKFRWFDVKVRSEPIGSQSVWPLVPCAWRF